MYDISLNVLGGAGAASTRLATWLDGYAGIEQHLQRASVGLDLQRDVAPGKIDLEGIGRRNAHAMRLASKGA